MVQQHYLIELDGCRANRVCHMTHWSNTSPSLTLNPAREPLNPKWNTICHFGRINAVNKIGDEGSLWFLLHVCTQNEGNWTL